MQDLAREKDTDLRIDQYLKAVNLVKQGLLGIDLPVADDKIGQFGRAIIELKESIKNQFTSIDLLASITEKINAGLKLDDILSYAFESLQPIIPYDRIGFSLLKDDGKTVYAYWARSNLYEDSALKITGGYSLSIEKTSLGEIIKTGKPRIINDLAAYLRDHPESEATKLIFQEGVRSSLTCPLITSGKVIGFMFFSSTKTDTYRNAHVELFLQIAGQLAIIVEKGRLYQREAELNTLKSKFLGMAVHDLRSPLSVLKSYISLFLEGFLGEVSDSQRDYFISMQEICETMLTMINDLLDISAIQLGQLKTNFVEVDLAEYLKNWYLNSSLLAKAKSIELKLELMPDLPKMLIDPNRVNQILDNLLTNAIKFSYPETVITVRAEVIGETVEISVQDQGQGIPESEIPKLFLEFSKLSVRPTSDEKSTGLGLAIVKRLVEAHNGRIWAESKEGVGSTFTFSLPLPEKTAEY